MRMILHKDTIEMELGLSITAQWPLSNIHHYKIFTYIIIIFIIILILLITFSSPETLKTHLSTDTYSYFLQSNMGIKSSMGKFSFLV